MSRFTRHICFYSAVFVLGACAYAQDNTFQHITFETPGAESAKCHVYVEGFHYPVNIPGTISVGKSKEDMKVRCLAPGNRVRTATIPAEISPTFKENANNAYVGAAWDALSGAMYRYPDLIKIDFTGVDQKDYPLPKHDAYDLRPTYEYALEEFLPSQPRLNADRFSEPTTLKKIDRSGGSPGGFESDLSSAFGPTPQESASRPSLGSDASLPPELPVSLSDLATRPSARASGAQEFPSVPSTVFDDDFSRFNQE